MTHKTFRRIALSLNGAIEASHMGHPDFRVANKIFASLHPDLKSGMVKLTPDQQKTFICEESTSFAPESGAWGRSGCTRVTLATVDEDSLGQALTLAWQNIAANKPSVQPKKKARRPPRAQGNKCLQSPAVSKKASLTRRRPQSRSTI
jgi:hypothetical protein